MHHIYAGETKLNKKAIPPKNTKKALARHAVVGFENCYEVFSDDITNKDRHHWLLEQEELENDLYGELQYCQEVDDMLYVTEEYGGCVEKEVDSF